MALTLYDTLILQTGDKNSLKVYTGSLGAGTNEAVFTPAAGNRIFVVGLLGSDTTPTTLSLNSYNGSVRTAMATFELGLGVAAVNPIQLPPGFGFIAATKVGESLELNSSAAYTGITVYAIEALKFDMATRSFY
jgi:hypothetical protein